MAEQTIVKYPGESIPTDIILTIADFPETMSRFECCDMVLVKFGLPRVIVSIIDDYVSDMCVICKGSTLVSGTTCSINCAKLRLLEHDFKQSMFGLSF